MSERITEAELRRLEKRTDSFGLVAEVRRLRAIILQAANSTPPIRVEDAFPLIAEAEAIRAEEGK